MDGSNEWPILEPWAVIRIEFSGQLDRKRDDESNFRTPRADPALRGEREIYSATFHYTYLCVSLCVSPRKRGTVSFDRNCQSRDGILVALCAVFRIRTGLSISRIKKERDFSFVGGLEYELKGI